MNTFAAFFFVLAIGVHGKSMYKRQIDFGTFIPGGSNVTGNLPINNVTGFLPTGMPPMGTGSFPVDINQFPLNPNNVTGNLPLDQFPLNPNNVTGNLPLDQFPLNPNNVTGNLPIGQFPLNPNNVTGNLPIGQFPIGNITSGAGNFPIVGNSPLSGVFGSQGAASDSKPSWTSPLENLPGGNVTGFLPTGMPSVGNLGSFPALIPSGETAAAPVPEAP